MVKIVKGNFTPQQRLAVLDVILESANGLTEEKFKTRLLNGLLCTGLITKEGE